MVAINPRLSLDDPIKRMWLRPSMKKFQSEHQVIEVLNKSQYIPCYLNRQVLMILSSLGVPDHTFMQLQDTMLEEMSTMLTKSEAARDAISCHLRLLPNIGGKSFADFEVSCEPFFRKLLVAIYRKQLSDLLTKSRVFIPRGRILIGCIDETGTLKQNEVFVQCSRVMLDRDEVIEGFLYDAGREMFTVLGPVAIAKNPCMHPGDLQLLQAVHVPHFAAFYHDCIVFPATGPRPITDMCSGSDLDGDLYFVAWEPRLLPRILHEPMEYAPSAAQEVEGGVQVPHMHKFLVDFIANDQLGTIANAHVAHVDQKPLGVRDPLCIKLAYLFSLAVDFPKTGFVPTFPKEARITKWPDFMQKKNQPSYVSDKVIGCMFRKAKGVPVAERAMHAASVVDTSFVLPNLEGVVEEARIVYARYCDELVHVLRVYRIQSEAQLFAHAVCENGQLGREETKDVLEIAEKKVRIILSHFRTEFFAGSQDTGALESVDAETMLLKRASAWYYASYSEPCLPYGLEGPILSFAWIVGDVLLQVRALNRTRVQGPSRVVSFAANIGHGVLAWAAGYVKDTVANQLVERLYFVNLIKANLEASLGKRPLELSVVGSTATGILDYTSDINMVLQVTEPYLAQSVYPVLEDIFTLKFVDGQIEHRGQPFSFTIGLSNEGVSVCQFIGRVLCSNRDALVLSLVITRWARSRNLVRRTTHHRGKLSATALVLLLIGVGGFEQQGQNAVSFEKVDLVLQWLQDTQEAIKAMTDDSLWEPALGSRLLGILQAFAFGDAQTLVEMLQTWHMSVNMDGMQSLREHAFQAYHLLAQTMSVTALWESAMACDIELEIALSRKPKLMKKLGKSNAIFMSGATVFMMEGAHSQLDRILFAMHRNRRRPQHITAQCYIPILREPAMVAWSQMQGKVYTDFVAHVFRQIDLLRQMTTEDIGLLRLVIKFGYSYMMCLPRLFLEEGHSASVESIQKALDLGYKAAGDTSALCKPLGNMVLELPKKRTEDMESVETSTVLIADSNAESQSLKPQRTRKKTLTAMKSSFEPSIASDEPLMAALARFHFASRTEAQTSLSVFLRLHNAASDRSKEVSAIYNSNMAFVRLMTRPVKWMAIDIKSAGAEAKEMPDMRFMLTTKQVVDTSDQRGKGIFDLIERGVLEEMQSEVEAEGRFRVSQPFLENESIFARHAHAKCFRPTLGTVSSMGSRYPQVRQFSQALWDKVRVMLLYVTEYSEHDVQSGKFRSVVEKIEVEVHLAVEWAEMHNAAFAQEMIPAMWILGHVFKEASING